MSADDSFIRSASPGEDAHNATMQLMGLLDQTLGPVITSNPNPEMTASLCMTAMSSFSGLIFGNLVAEDVISLDVLDQMADGLRDNFVRSVQLYLQSDTAGAA